MTYDVRIPVGLIHPQPAEIMRRVVTVTDPDRQARACFGRGFSEFCKYTRVKNGEWSAIPSRSWCECEAVFGSVRLVGFRRLRPGTLAYTLIDVFKRACA